MYLLTVLLALVIAAGYGVFAYRWGKEPGRGWMSTAVATLVAALLALALYQYGESVAEKGRRDRLVRLLAIELSETLHALDVVRAAWDKTRTGEIPRNYIVTPAAVVPDVVAEEALRSGLFPEAEDALLRQIREVRQYTAALQRFELFEDAHRHGDRSHTDESYLAWKRTLSNHVLMVGSGAHERTVATVSALGLVGKLPTAQAPLPLKAASRRPGVPSPQGVAPSSSAR